MLSKKDHWDNIYNHKVNKSRFESYCDSYFFNLCKKHIPNQQNLKFIEIGCAPGHYLLKFNKLFGFDVYGVDYSETGCQQTKDNFKLYGLSGNNIILSNFLDNGFQSTYKESFDVVYSGGFLEHFEDSTNIINNHMNLLKPGGYLIIAIPDLSGINRTISDFLNPEITKICNPKIMNINTFSGLFDRKDLERLYCDYYGMFTFGVFNVPPTSNKRFFMQISGYLQILMLDRLYFTFFMNHDIKCGLINPFLVYIGKKR